jgi:hypothetical protein
MRQAIIFQSDSLRLTYTFGSDYAWQLFERLAGQDVWTLLYSVNSLSGLLDKPSLAHVSAELDELLFLMGRVTPSLSHHIVKDLEASKFLVPGQTSRQRGGALR